MITAYVRKVGKFATDAYEMTNEANSVCATEWLDLRFPEADGKEDEEVTAEMLLLRDLVNSLARACEMLTEKLTEVVEVGEEEERA